MRTLKEIRKAKGYSLRKLAVVSNCTFPQLCLFETGKSLPSKTTQAWLEIVLGEPIYFPILSHDLKASKDHTEVKNCAIRFRYLLRMIKSLPEDERKEFSSLVINYLIRLITK